ncbi:MAG: hypothetical protein U0807_17355 [Candidatus Binatia bacterium]
MARADVVAMVLAGGLLAARSVSATTAADLCSASADPCVVASDVIVTSGAVIDVGARTLVVKRGKSLDVGGGSMTIRAGSLQVQPGASISGRATGVGGSIVVELAGDLDIQVDGTTRGRIDVGADGLGGTATITVGGNATVAGFIAAAAGTTEADGGSISLYVTGDVSIAGSVVAPSGAQGLGGDIEVFAGGAISAPGTIDVSGGDGGAGTLDLDAGTTLSVGSIAAFGGGSSGDAGDLTLTANGDITIGGQIEGYAAGTTGNGGGAGVQLQIVSLLGTIRVSAQVQGQGGTPDGDGGMLDIEAGRDVIVTAPLKFQGIGIDSCGGDVLIAAANNASVAAIDVSGGSCGDGSVSLDANGTVSVGGEINGDAAGSGQAADISIGAEQVSVGAVDVHADTGMSGRILLRGCSVTIPAGASVSAQGPDGRNSLRASGLLTVAGSVRAGGANVVEYRSQAPSIAGGSMVPAPTLTQDGTLPVCRSGVCGDGTLDPGEACDDGDSTSCDGCSASCRVEGCGNGVVECTEQCDLGGQNGVPGSGCDAFCRTVTVAGVLYIPGRPRGSVGCFLEVGVQNPSGDVRNGYASSTQTCVDGDPLCDADGVNDGVCTFHLTSCLHVTDPRLPDCRILSVTSVDLKRPSLPAPADAVDATNAQALASSLLAFQTNILTDGSVLQSHNPDPRADVCTAPVAVRVPHAPGARARRRINIETRDLPLRRSRNVVRLVCENNPAVCGNGVVEVGEVCDDGNRASCDGCNADCRPEACGDGVLQCAEECDNGSHNGQPGDPCLADCTLAPPALRIPGGGKGLAECATEWAMAIGQAALDRRGLPDFKQECHDNDPTCDFDATAGTCRLHLWACLGGEDQRLSCPAQPVSAVQLVKPSDRQPGPARTALLNALGAVTVPVVSGERCTRRIEISLPASGKRFSVKTLAMTTAGTDKDGLKLRCSP